MCISLILLVRYFLLLCFLEGSGEWVCFGVRGFFWIWDSGFGEGEGCLVGGGREESTNFGMERWWGRDFLVVRE